MSKTPEELAEEYLRFENESNYWAKHAFLTGYQAGRSNSEAVQAAKDQVADTSKVMNYPDLPDSCNSSNNSNGWISVKQQMPDVHEEVLVNIIYPIEKIEKLAYRLEGDKAEWFVLPDPQGYFWNEEWVTHWMPLPKPPEEA